MDVRLCLTGYLLIKMIIIKKETMLMMFTHDTLH